ncbi:hypothetical protein BGZ70_009688 [Mortierella alpina]|uniref:Uncharacterized protein n=1 Tax=Mortierella alpina TaxID=64518 RepID=A0A9P6J0Y5_MORAP|nr:hypothetical protein BGZ70_009688 [Mortierella alpina]
MALADASAPLSPAIFRLSPELLAMIFHYVYVTPVVQRSVTAGPTDKAAGCTSDAGDVSSSPSPSSTTTASSSTASSCSSAASIPTSVSAASSSSSSSSSSSAPNPAVNTSPSPCSTALSTAGRRRRDRRKAAAAVYIQNDVASMLSVCLTCRAFYPQAVRMLWRQRTLAGYDDLSEFYRAIEFSASQRKRQQKQRQQEQEHLGRHHRKHQDQQGQRQDLGYAVEEELFNNEAALRIKSLTLLEQDRTSGPAAGAGDTSALPAAVDATSSLGSDSIASLSDQFFGSSSVSHHDGQYTPGGSGSGLDLCQGLDALQKTSSFAMDDSLLWAVNDKDEGTASSSSASSSSTSRSRSRSLSQSKRRSRQKTSSVYSQMLSPRLLNTIANHCYALVDLTVCMEKRTLSTSLSRPSSPSQTQQPTIPFSILAGSILNLKRLTLIGLICDPRFNKTGSELLMFAKNVQPLERISLRSCQGIGVETFVQFAARSHRRLKAIDFQSLDFATTQELTDTMSAYAYHCRNLSSITLSCVNALALDGTMEALAFHQAYDLQELHVLGHDIVLAAPQQQQQQPQAQPPGLAAHQQQQQQQQPGDLNDNTQNGAQAHVTQMCHFADATAALSSLAQIRLRRLTLYCPGITDYALFLYICRSSQLVDLVLNEPATMLHHEQFQGFVQLHLPDTAQHMSDIGVHSEATPVEAALGQQGPDAPATPPSAEPAPFTSAGFLKLILHKCHWLKYLFMKLTLETAQEWIAQPCFREAGLDKCLYQYRTATGTPAVVLMWDARKKVVHPMMA